VEISLLQWNNFIPPADPFFKQQAAEWGKQTGVNVTVETINAVDLLPRFIAALNAQSGPTIFQTQDLQPHILAQGLRDVTDLASEVEAGYGRFYPVANGSARVNGRYRGIPWTQGSAAFVYRKSWFQQAGARVPETWNDLGDVVMKMAAFGKPVGQAFSQSVGDPPAWCYPIMWAFGGKELEADGRTVAINSSETIDAIRFTVDLWKSGLDHRGLGWDDSGNNIAFLTEEISATLNGASIYFVGAGLDGRSTPKPWSNDMDHFLTPAGPAGRFQTGTAFTHAIPTYVEGKELAAATEFLRFVHNPKQFDAWFELNQGFTAGPGERMESHPMWASLPKTLLPFNSGRISRAVGHAASPSLQAAQVQARFIVVNMFARAIQGQTPEESARYAESEMRQVYT
jgi:multiple sugar transport system substrate-binding protein